ncbi:hypothetical protein [Burkholderia diffusa]|uniref:Uncharacterized protein n=1 Tax=Burkholderia diffusa TaxID=488732 RepID=A0A6P2JK43_9BURK|nr:hypothetical protein [Burkholderia diffusa]KAB0652529.1 hypothetical protein F7R23_20860 [Burkholderia diffusa]MBM2653639.1 hypothetical protein [Burkholderia diffusa]VWB44153.1 hypothetical protein BDI24065_01995 [Burkholderia diffusa]
MPARVSCRSPGGISGRRHPFIPSAGSHGKTADPRRTDPNALVVGPTGLAYAPNIDVPYVASTDDNTNTATIWTLRSDDNNAQ